MLRRNAVVLTAAVTILILVPSSVLGNNINHVMWEAFQDYLKGKSVAIIKFTVIPVHDRKLVAGRFLFTVHNMTNSWKRPHSDVVYCSEANPFLLKINRIPSKFDPFKNRVVYQEHEYTFYVDSDEWSGGKLLKVEPEKPYMELTVFVNVTRRGEDKQQQSLFSGFAGGDIGVLGWYLIETSTTTNVVPAVQIHSIQGISTAWRVEIGNYLYWSQKSKYWRSIEPKDWNIDGDKSAPSNAGFTTSSISEGAKRWINTYADFRYEYWGYYLRGVRQFRKIVYPVSWRGYQWGDYITCSLCGGPKSGNYGAWPQGTPSPIEVSLGNGIREIERSGFSITISTSIGPFTMSMELWKEIEKGTSTYPPKILVTVTQWVKPTLYVFDANTQWKIVHFTWNP